MSVDLNCSFKVEFFWSLPQSSFHAIGRVLMAWHYCGLSLKILIFGCKLQLDAFIYLSECDSVIIHVYSLICFQSSNSGYAREQQDYGYEQDYTADTYEQGYSTSSR